MGFTPDQSTSKAEHFSYQGNELELFSQAHNWKSYYGNRIKPYLGEDVLEVGAGIGATTHSLCDGGQRSWVCLEPDTQMAGKLSAAVDAATLPACCVVRRGTTADLRSDEQFNSILYIDVLEHLEDDRDEVIRATAHLKAGGFLIVLSPAFQWLFSPFDHAIGHCRRYTAKTLRAIIPPELEKCHLHYFDSVGLLASLCNKLILKHSYPSKAQITFWDRTIIPVTRVTDPLMGYSFGRSVFGVWRRRG